MHSLGCAQITTLAFNACAVVVRCIGVLLRQKNIHKQESHSHMKDRWSQFEIQYLCIVGTQSDKRIEKKPKKERDYVRCAEFLHCRSVRVAKDVLSIKRNLCFTICI